MQSVPRKSLAESAAAELRRHLDSGRLSGLLPGVRMLALDLDVSVPIVCRALHLLAEEGRVQTGGGKRRWRACEGSAKNPVPDEDTVPKGRISGRLLFLASQSLSEERHSGIEIISELLDQLESKGWEVMHRVVNFRTAKNPRRSWDELLKLTSPDTLVVVSGTPAVAKWATGHGIRTLFVGGDAGEFPLPMLAIRFSTMYRYALDRLLGAGHMRVLLTLCDRSPEFLAKSRELIIEATDAAGVDRNSALVVATPYSGPEVIVALLAQQWKRQPPDALVFLDWREYLAASSFLNARGIAIPRDLSVVILSHSVNMMWHLPPISHFEHPSKALARGISNWVMKGQLRSGGPGSLEIRARWVEGKSVIDRR